VKNMKKQYIVGIDLGTSNTVVAYHAPGRPEIELFAIDQLVGPGQVAARPLLPSVRYHPAAGEIKPGELQLPWQTTENDEPVITGRLALDLGAQVPGRLVASAKSWLSHASVDRLAPSCPGVPRTASPRSRRSRPARAISRMCAPPGCTAFPQAPLEQQQVILTVPASFDEGARALTLAAARQAGLPGCACSRNRKRLSTTGCSAIARSSPTNSPQRGCCWSATSVAAPPT
jgi:molecular chaperone DnaK (HSP70)